MMVWKAFADGIEPSTKAFRRVSSVVETDETRAIAGVRRCCRAPSLCSLRLHRDGAAPLLSRMNRSPLARAQAFAARDLAARCSSFRGAGLGVMPQACVCFGVRSGASALRRF